MAATDINKVIITGNLTRDPELHTTQSGFAICSLRLASNTTRKDGDQFVDKPNYFDVKVLGKQGENCAKYLAKGRPVAVDGKLEWREFTTKTGDQRQAVEIVVDFNGSVKFLGSGQGNNGGGNAGADSEFSAATASAPEGEPGDDARAPDFPF